MDLKVSLNFIKLFFFSNGEERLYALFNDSSSEVKSSLFLKTLF